MQQKTNTIHKNLIPFEELISRTTPRENEQSDPRGPFFRDVTAILHSSPFRRLKHKTQVFFAPSNDHICTRLEHVLHVSTIAVTICKALRLDTDLAWAIALGHDLGHTPFGHLGEEVLDALSFDTTKKHFHHEIHSLRVVDKIAQLNLCYAVRDGIVTHCGEKFEQSINPTHKIASLDTYTDKNNYAATFEGCVVRMADKIAYLGRDIEDAITFGILSQDHFQKIFPTEIKNVLGSTNKDIINSLTLDLIEYSRHTNCIGFSEKIHHAMLILHKFNAEHIYSHEVLETQKEKFKKLLHILYHELLECTQEYGNDIECYTNAKSPFLQNFGTYLSPFQEFYKLDDPIGRIDAIIDFIAGMTDDYLITSVKQHLFPTIELHKITQLHI